MIILRKEPTLTLSIILQINNFLAIKLLLFKMSNNEPMDIEF